MGLSGSCDFRRFVLIILVVRSVQVSQWPALMYLINVDMEGLNADLW